jgi:hypothetical protein
MKNIYEGMVFENTPEGRRNMWSLFLATIYHLSAHAATLPYSQYQKWENELITTIQVMTTRGIGDSI